MSTLPCGLDVRHTSLKSLECCGAYVFARSTVGLDSVVEISDAVYKHDGQSVPDLIDELPPLSIVINVELLCGLKDHTILRTAAAKNDSGANVRILYENTLCGPCQEHLREIQTCHAPNGPGFVLGTC